MIDLINYIGRCSSRESTYRLADFFNRWWDEYAQHPAEYILLDLVKRNKKEILNILMRTSADTLKDWMMHKFGLKTGVIAVLHTYGETKQLHVHTHMIMSWGGIDSEGKIGVPLQV